MEQNKWIPRHYWLVFLFQSKNSTNSHRWTKYMCTTNHIVRNKCTSTSFCFFKYKQHQLSHVFVMKCYNMLSHLCQSPHLYKKKNEYQTKFIHLYKKKWRPKINKWLLTWYDMKWILNIWMRWHGGI